MKPELTAQEIEIALAQHFGYVTNLIVPNVWAMFNHECDLLIVSQSKYAIEIEIKITAADLRKELKKKHKHYSEIIKRLFFAVPEGLSAEIQNIPETAGFITVRKSKYGDYIVEIIRPAKLTSARKLNQEEILKLAKLGSMRIWKLKLALKNRIYRTEKLIESKAI